MATPFFDWKGFCSVYLQTSKYSKRDSILTAFSRLWTGTFGAAYGLGNTPTWGFVRKNFTSENKKKWKIQLMGQGHTAAGVDGLYKSFSSWLSANK